MARFVSPHFRGVLASAWSCLGIDAAELQNRVARSLATGGAGSLALQQVVAEFIAPAALGDQYSPGMFSEFHSQQARFSVLFEALSTVYAYQPLIIWMDDVHWGTDALQFLLQTDSGRTSPTSARDDASTLVPSPDPR